MTKPLKNRLAFFQKEALLAIESGAVREINFSGPTYQVEVKLNGTSFWPFFQFNERYEVKDSFCSCESENGCLHQVIAYLAIFQGKIEPLHVRYDHSFWKKLCQILADFVGFSVSSFKKVEKSIYDCGPSAWEFKGDLLSKLNEFLKPKEKKDTPENSLKFSNLSQDEIQKWREGRPSLDLRFELSFWSDLAKHLFFLQEKSNPFFLEVVDAKESFPSTFTVRGDGLYLSCTLDLEEFSQLIPSLQTIPSNLEVISAKKGRLVEINYSPVARSLFLKFANDTGFIKSKEGIEAGGWRYVYKKGFYSTKIGKENPLEEIKSDKIGDYLDKHAEEGALVCKGFSIHLKKTLLSYVLYFDEEWDLHIESFLFEKGDLKAQQTAFYDHWLYMHKKGFYPLFSSPFLRQEKVVSSNQLSLFIHQHKLWLQEQKGFSVHLAPLATHLSYCVSNDGQLKFFGKWSGEGKVGRSKDFGEWIFIEELGFFSKETEREVLLYPGLEVPSYYVSDFIHSHQNDLENVPRFFLQQLPLVRRGLALSVETSGLQITIVNELKEELKNKKTLFFGDYVYVQAEGFFQLPLKMRLPDLPDSQIVTEENLETFITEQLPLLKSYVIEEELAAKLQKTINLEVTFLKRNLEGGIWLELAVISEAGTENGANILRAVLQNKRFFLSKAGLLDLHSDQFLWLKILKLSSSKESVFELSVLDFLKLDSIKPLEVTQEETESGSQTRQLFQEIKAFHTLEKLHPTLLKSHLRHYQQTGLEWLWFLFKNALSGLLCDEMGLGKTHQAMGLMALMAEIGSKGPFLIVCPTSVIYHWQDKLSDFLPSLSIHVFHGYKRSIMPFKTKHILLTSYGILRSEIETLKEIGFELAIFDEIQYAKNARSGIHVSLLQIKSKMRLGLTGTPIENNLRELKSLFDVVLPNFMPSEQRFRELFLSPIEKMNDPDRKSMLSRLIKPFILRRKKSEVLEELPEKSEDNSYCELSPLQKELYQEFLEKRQAALISELKDASTPVPYLHIFSLLSTLKQICDHPALFYKKPHLYKEFESGKWELFKELLDEAMQSSQKVVIFSQYLQMLEIMEAYLSEKGIEYALIRGETVDRRGQIEKFQKDPQCRVFLGSLMAAGVGIDLTAASVVFLYNRWWNAARENQAIDRVHRIGQKRGVQVYRFITKQTIEEKIDRMIAKKAKLLEEIVTIDDQSAFKQFTREELIELLSFDFPFSLSK